MHALVLAYGLLNLGGIIASYIYTVTRMRGWIVPRFEQISDLSECALFPPIVLPGMATVAYVTRLGSIHRIPDWMIRQLIERGYAPHNTSRESVLRHFSPEEIRQARWITTINMALIASLLLLNLIHRFVYKLL